MQTCSVLSALFTLALLGAVDPPQCRDSQGKPVDWWFIYKEDGGMRYVYYDSRMAKENRLGRHKFRSMSSKYLLDDPVTSPILHTIYGPLEPESTSSSSSSSSEEDPSLWSDEVFIGVNDQPAQRVKRNHRDAFKKPVSTASGHVKFFAAAQVNFGGRPMEEKATVYSYLIQHSLPRFPNVSIDGKGTHERIFANRLPSSRKNIFSGSSKAKGQHFMCMSFQDKQMLDDQPQVATADVVVKTKKKNLHEPHYQLKYRRDNIGDYLKDGNHNFVSVLHYLKVVHGVVVATNYDPFDSGFEVFHQYLNTYGEWSSAETQKQEFEKNLNMSRTSVNGKAGNCDSTHLCPIWPLNRRVRIGADGKPAELKVYKGDEFEIFSMRSSGDASTAVCRAWSLDEPDEDKLCLTSANLVTTNEQYKLEGLLIMKASPVTLSLFDDLIAPMAVKQDDYNIVPANNDVYSMEMGLIVQSWIDNATLPKDSKQLLPADSQLQVRLTIENNSGVHLPVKDSTNHHHLVSLGLDHSKWALLVARGTTGNLPELFCVADLNRTHKQEKRGGAALCFSQAPFTELMLSLRPSIDPGYSRKIPFDKLEHLYANFKQTIGTAVQIDEDHIFMGSERDQGHVCIHRLPNPFKEKLSSTLAVPDLQLGITKDDQVVKVTGDVHLPSTIVKRATDLTPYYTHAKDRSSFYTGPSMLVAASREGHESSKVKSTGKDLVVPLGFWTRLQQAFHVTSFKGSDFTRTWLERQMYASRQDTKTKKK